MNRIIYLISCSFLLSVPFHGFELNKYSKYLTRSNGNFPDSNGIIDIESEDNDVIWIGTGAGLGYLNTSLNSEILFESVDAGSNIPTGGTPALFVESNIIVYSGVTQEYMATTESYEPKGTGIGYSIDSGISWNYMPQPICTICEALYQSIPWGEQYLVSLAVTTEVNNVSYDVGVKGNYVYASSWAGGLRRFDYSLVSPAWEVIPLPMDEQDSLMCDFIDLDSYELNPRDPNDGGNHNHKGFSVLGTDNYLWVGTANGINRGTINGDCINWYHQTTANGLSGDWVVGIENQLTDSIDRIWAITWSAGPGQFNSISYTDNYGVSWQEIDYFTEKNIKIYNLDFDEEKVYAASEEGLFYSEDLIHWEKISRSWIDSITGDIILDETVYSVFIGDALFIGTGEGLVIDDQTYRFWNNSAELKSENLGFSVYPNPFFTSQDGVFNGDGHVHFIYYNPNNLKSEIDIYDFTMQHVIKLSEKINIDDESIMIWDGRDKTGNRVVNGTYFCKLIINNTVYWTKLMVIN